jgi:hypothetical protein
MIPILTDFTTKPHVLYHVSPKLFDFPSRDEINKAREWSRWHANGVLGLWCSTFPRMCSAFGTYTYRVELREDARRIGLTIEDFCDLTSNMKDFTDTIAFLTQQGDMAYIIDINPHVGEVIILNFDCIASFTNVTGSDLKDERILLTLNCNGVNPQDEKTRAR